MISSFTRSLSLILSLSCPVLLLRTGAAAGTQILDIPPGGFAWAALTADGLPALTTEYAMAPGPWMTSEPLPLEEILLLASGIAADEATIQWLAGLTGLRVRLNDLMHRPVDAGSDAEPFFADIDRDGDQDLLVRDGTGGTHAYRCPGWREVTRFYLPENVSTGADLNGDSVEESVRPCGDGALVFEGDGLPFDTLSGFAFGECTGAALGDMEGDGLADLVVGLPSGRILVYRNRGTATEPLFLRWSRESRRLLPMQPGTFSAPAPFVEGDSVLVLPVGTARTGLIVYRSALDGAGSPSGGWVQTEHLLPGGMNVSPAVAGDSSGALLAAVRTGEIIRLAPGPDGWSSDTLIEVPGTYPVICPYDADGDAFPDLIAGTLEGTVHLLRGLPGGGYSAAEPLDGFPSVPCGAPAPYESGLLMGSREGGLRYFVPGPDGSWCDSTAGSVFEGIFIGEYSAPSFCDLDTDGVPELIVGSADGRLVCFGLAPDGRDGGPVYQETQSWGFQPNSAVSGLDRYYARYFPEYVELMTPSDSLVAGALLREILVAPPSHMDEVAMAIALTPTEVLRTMYLEGDSDLFRVNAQLIYEAADALPYAELRDTTGPDGGPATDLILSTREGWRMVDRDDYYRFVVTPRVMFEIPARVDASYWLEPRDTVWMSEEAWLNEEPEDLYADCGEHLFWRESIPSDSSYGSSLISSASQASTLEEAVLRLCNWQSHSQPTGLMTFGYLTDDLQPLVIYRKAYGSCGEQSILQTAMCRALLIPACVVGCRGEDHQWNEFMDPATGRWTHWDVNYGSAEISHIWVSGEGVDHTGKTISTITAFGPDDSVLETTGSAMGVPDAGYMPGDSGYTPTATVEVCVSDASGRPVEGAMVLVRSHWERRNMVSMVTWTDISGLCLLDLGWEPFGGYTIDVVTPFGAAGYSCFHVEEGHRYTARITVPGSRPSPQEIELPADPASCETEFILSDTLALWPVSYYNGRLYTLDTPPGSEEAEESYNGARWSPGPRTPCDRGAAFMDRENLGRYLRGESCRAVPAPFIPAPGDSCYILIDNRGSLFSWRRVELDLGSLPVPSADGDVSAAWLDRTPAPRVQDWTLPAPPDPTELESLPAGPWTVCFRGVRIFQDEASDPLSSGWVLGPFMAAGDERSLTISSSAVSDGFDMDMYLFCDLNGNRLVDSMDELLLSSTSPEASEEITLHDPVPGSVYWVYLLGWSVPDSGGVLDLGLDFTPRQLRIRSLAPVGPVGAVPSEFTFSLDPPQAEGERLVASFGQWEVSPRLTDETWTFSQHMESPLSTCPEAMLLDADGRVIERASWSIIADSLPPMLPETETRIDTAGMKLEIQARVTDAGVGVASVSAHFTGMQTVQLARGSGGIWTGQLDLLQLGGSVLTMTLTAEDAAGNLAASDTLLLLVPETPPVMFRAVSPVGITYDNRPLIQFYPDVAEGGGWSATAIIEQSGTGIVVVPDVMVCGPDAAQFRPAAPLALGDWSVTVTVEGDSLEAPVSSTWEFTVAKMGAIPE